MIVVLDELGVICHNRLDKNSGPSVLVSVREKRIELGASHMSSDLHEDNFTRSGVGVGVRVRDVLLPLKSRSRLDYGLSPSSSTAPGTWLNNPNAVESVEEIIWVELLLDTKEEAIGISIE